MPDDGTGKSLRWVGLVEAFGALLALTGWLAGNPGVLWAGVAVLLVATLAFAPLLALARLGQARPERGGGDRSGNATDRASHRR